MIDTQFRQPFQQRLIDPICHQVIKTSVTPLQLTGLAALSGVLCCPFVALGWSSVALGLLLLSGLFDTLDGTLARYRQMSSPLGAVCDICADRLVEFSVLLGLFLFAPGERAIPCFFMLGSCLLCITTFLVVGVFTENQGQKSFHYSPGLMERAEAFTFFTLMIGLPQYFCPLAWSFSLLVLWTAIKRLWDFAQSQQP